MHEAAELESWRKVLASVDIIKQVTETTDLHQQFKRIFMGEYRNVLAYALRRTANLADAQDVVAETFTVAWRRIEDAPQDEALKPWLYAIAYHTIANQHRSRRRLEALREQLKEQPSPLLETHNVVVQSDDLRTVLSALASLSEGDQEILRLAAWEDLSHAEIGAVLDCSENAAAIRLHRARRRLAEEVSRRGDVNEPGTETLRRQQVEEGR
jgi:RNA polymerase sigma-70 factor (ECF subfamily)